MYECVRPNPRAANDRETKSTRTEIPPAAVIWAGREAGPFTSWKTRGYSECSFTSRLERDGSLPRGDQPRGRPVRANSRQIHPGKSSDDLSRSALEPCA